MHIYVDKNICIGAGACTAIAKDIFQSNKDGKTIIKTTKDEKQVRMAAEACPVQAIFLYDDKRNQIFPKIKKANN